MNSDGRGAPAIRPPTPAFSRQNTVFQTLVRSNPCPERRAGCFSMVWIANDPPPRGSPQSIHRDALLHRLPCSLHCDKRLACRIPELQEIHTPVPRSSKCGEGSSRFAWYVEPPRATRGHQDERFVRGRVD